MTDMFWDRLLSAPAEFCVAKAAAQFHHHERGHLHMQRALNGLQMYVVNYTSSLGFSLDYLKQVLHRPVN